MKSELIIEVVEQLIGSIETIGDSAHDEKSHNNLKKAIELTEHLIREINYVARDCDQIEFTRKRSGELAENFMQQLSEWR